MTLAAMPPRITPVDRVEYGTVNRSRALDLREPVGDLADEDHQARRVLDGVHAIRHIAGMRLAPCTAQRNRCVPLWAMMGCIEVGSPTTQPRRTDAALLQVANQSAHADAAHFLVVAQRIMQRRIEPTSVQRRDELRRLGQRDADESLHVGGAARIELAVALHA